MGDSVITIVDWAKHYENNRTRVMKHMSWVPMPNSHDGFGYCTLLDHPEGAAHFGAWCALVEVASRCEVRGILMRGNGKPYNTESLSKMTKIPISVWETALPRLVSIGWVSLEEIQQEGAGSRQDPAGSVQEGAGSRQDPAAKGREQNRTEGREGKGRECDPPPTPSAKEPKTVPVNGKTSKHPLPHQESPMFRQLMDIHRKATGTGITLSDGDAQRLISLEREHGEPSVLQAYEICQREKPGKVMRFFLDDFARYIAKVRPAASRSPPGPKPKGLEDQKAEREWEETEFPDLAAEAEQKAEAFKAKAGLVPAASEPDDFGEEGGEIF
jgi:hypothetical protein